MGEHPKFYVDRRGETKQEKLRRFEAATPLYGTAARVDETGNILIQRWREEQRGTISPGSYSSLSKRQQPDAVLMRRGLKTRSVSSREVVEFDGVEAAIRSVGYILEGQKREQRQTAVILQRTRYLIDFFQENEVSKIPVEQRRRLQEETIAMLSEVGLDPESVQLEVKMLMILWTAKGSSAEDSLGRVNELITFQELYAAEKLARKRAIAVQGNITLKYSPIGGAYALARTTSRENTFAVGDEVDRRLLPNVYLDNPDTPIWRDIDHTIRVVQSLSDLLEDVLVNPYKEAALLGIGYLKQTEGLLKEKTQAALRQLHDRGFVQGVRQVMSLDPEVGLFGRVLAENAYVYPEYPTES